jgi:hypothetical protein
MVKPNNIVALAGIKLPVRAQISFFLAVALNTALISPAQN